MYTRFKKINSSGFTLVEIIASIAILGMVIAVLLPIFPQIMNWTQNTDDELVASNLLSKAADDIKSNTYVTNIVENSLGVASCSNSKGNVVAFKENENMYKINEDEYEYRLEATLCQDKDELKLEIYRTHLKIYAVESNTPISDTFIYLTKEGVK